MRRLENYCQGEMMFDIHPKVLAHKSACEKGNFVTPEYILHKRNLHVGLMRRYCPHRQYPLGEIGTINTGDIRCNFHGYTWDKTGIAQNNNRSLLCGSANIGESGLILKDFKEPNAGWINDISQESNLEYSHTCAGQSSGSWLWMMEVQADLLHITVDQIHPILSKLTDLNKCIMTDGDGWINQTCETGWWTFIYPYTFIEWSPGCLAINYTTPNNVKQEFGFGWHTQFYYAPEIDAEKKTSFESLQTVFEEDITAIEQQQGGYYPLLATSNRLEKHCVHWGEWYKAHGIS